MSWKDNAQTYGVQEIRRAVADNALAKDILNARKQFVQARIHQETQVYQMYVELGKDLRKELGKKTTTIPRRELKRIQAQIDLETRRLASKLGDVLDVNIKAAVEAGSYPHKQQSKRLFFGKKVDQTLVTSTGIDKAFVRVNHNAVLAIMSRTYKGSKLLLSDRVWNVGVKNSQAIAKILEYAVTTGETYQHTALKLEQYLKSKTPVSNYYRTRVPGLPKDIKYEALRLVRTEVSSAFMEGSYIGGQANPGYLGIEWRLSPSHPRADICDPWHGEFFPAGHEPSIPHPQCLCIQIPKYESLDSFNTRLQKWVNDPSEDDRLEQWYQNTYRGA